MRLVLEEDGRVAVCLADGRLVVFAPTAPGSRRYYQREQLELEHQAEGQYRVWNVRERVWYGFAAHPARPEQVLVAVADTNGFAIRLAYSAAGHLRTLTDRAGRCCPWGRIGPSNGSRVAPAARLASQGLPHRAPASARGHAPPEPARAAVQSLYPRTTDSTHGLRRVPNRLLDQPKPAQPNQV